ncbi:MAG: glycine cleavage system aminomethyltransferase GcvT [Maritimibacter sp.]
MSGMKRTFLYDLHLEFGAKMVPFAGWEMPVQYAPGVMREHLHTRAEAGIFDVSHMGQVILRGPNVAEALEKLVPVDVVGLKENRQRYAMFTTPEGGIIDDLMITNKGDHFYLVVNAGRYDVDMAHMRANLPGIEIEALTDRALIAVQGPRAVNALSSLNFAAAEMGFMSHAEMELAGVPCWVSRSGYTGEDGFEISVPGDQAIKLARAIWDTDIAHPIGLGARDSLRLEAGLCLYGNDITESTSPIEANLSWAIQKARRTGGAREGGFPGAERILKELADGPARLRVGILPEGRAPMRAHTKLFASEDAAEPIGEITSGAFGPSVEGPISMGYLPTDLAVTGTKIWGEVRGKRMPASVADLPFHPHSYKR